MNLRRQNDAFYTARSHCELVEGYLPKDEIPWESFYSPFSRSAEYLRSLGCQALSEDLDFYCSDLGQIIVSNPRKTEAAGIHA